jgi:NAD(P)-dependent dehydrogenase (short-subunit alcohol dehydrogenase family)
MLPPMKIIVIGSHGTIGSEIVKALRPAHEVVEVNRSGGAIRADIRDVGSLRKMFAEAGTVDAVVCAAGSGAWKPLDQLTDQDFAESLGHKLMGQVNVIRYGFAALRDGGSITVTSGVLSRKPAPNGAAVSLVNAGLEGFARAAALEAPRGIRVNVVSPPWVSETLGKMGMDPSPGTPATTVAKAYVALVTGSQTGQVVEP